MHSSRLYSLHCRTAILALLLYIHFYYRCEIARLIFDHFWKVLPQFHVKSTFNSFDVSWLLWKIVLEKTVKQKTFCFCVALALNVTKRRMKVKQRKYRNSSIRESTWYLVGCPVKKNLDQTLFIPCQDQNM